jgi:hypothetical protein
MDYVKCSAWPELWLDFSWVSLVNMSDCMRLNGYKLKRQGSMTLEAKLSLKYEAMFTTARGLSLCILNINPIAFY